MAKLNPTGSALVYFTYLGPAAGANGIAVDPAGNAYVTGDTNSTDFPTVNPLQATCGGCSSGKTTTFVAKLNAAGSALVYSTYLGGSLEDEADGIAVDSSGNAYVTGRLLDRLSHRQRISGNGLCHGGELLRAKLNAAGLGTRLLHLPGRQLLA